MAEDAKSHASAKSGASASLAAPVGPPPVPWRLKRSASSDAINTVPDPPKWIREKFPSKKIASTLIFGLSSTTPTSTSGDPTRT